MKYGETLRQRSIPEWGHYNIDYDYLKDVIKQNTTPGAGTAISIPGQGGTTERAFGEDFFHILRAQHDRINLFIKSKSGEIERRLDHINKQLSRTAAGQSLPKPAAPLRAKIVEKYAKYDADVSKAGEEIRSLSRFRTAQRTGFIKLLKKYRRWTKDPELGKRFKAEVMDKPDSFFRLDLGNLLDQYIDVLQAVRAPFQASNARRPSAASEEAAKVLASPAGSDGASTASLVHKAIADSSEVDYDAALSTIPLGANGRRATYWIHADNLLETHVLLLQHMRLHKQKSSPETSADGTPLRRRSNSALANMISFGAEDDVGQLILDKPESFAEKQNASTVADREEWTGTVRARGAGSAQWTSASEAIVVVGLESGEDANVPENIKIAKLKRKRLGAFLDTSCPFIFRRSSDTSPDPESKEEAPEDVASVRQWLTEHNEVKPMAGICSKRTRFVGLHNNPSGGLWAMLDRDIVMKGSLADDLSNNEWITNARAGSTHFPHAVLQIRTEGVQSTELIRTLDHSHLLERVRGFSLQAHAVWTCCKPSTMSAPFWLSALNKDIRKLPTPVKRRRKQVTIQSPGSGSPQSQSASTASLTDGQTSATTLPNGESSATSGPEAFQPPPLQAYRKKRRSFVEFLPPAPPDDQSSSRERYWNEYDHPEDGSDEGGYYVYLDPNETLGFPGQETLFKWAKKTKQFFRLPKKDEEAPLLSPIQDLTDDEAESDGGGTDYGTIGSSSATTSPPQSRHGNYFSSLFNSLKNPRRDLESIRRQSRVVQERESMFSLQLRQREREMTKFRFYATCLAASVVIDAILGTMASTSRRKARGAVDSAILFGTISNLLLLVVAMITMKTRKENIGLMHGFVVYGLTVAVVGADVALLCWVLMD